MLRLHRGVMGWLLRMSRVRLGVGRLGRRDERECILWCFVYKIIVKMRDDENDLPVFFLWNSLWPKAFEVLISFL